MTGVIFNYRDASENSGWICPKLQTHFAVDILLCGGWLKLQEAWYFLESSSWIPLCTRYRCGAYKLFCWFPEAHREFKMRQQMFAFIFTAPLEKKRTKKVDYSAEQAHAWVRAALFGGGCFFFFFNLLVKLEVLVRKILMAKQHFK